MRFNRVEFASRRRKAQDRLIEALEPVVAEGLDRKQAGSDTWWRRVVDSARTLFDGIVREDGGTPSRSSGDWASLSLDLAHALTKTRHIDEYSHTVIANMIANDVLSSATISAAKQAGKPFELEWISMHDGKVRHTHRGADGQRIHPGDRFQVGEARLRRPGDVTAPVEEWINCRCTVAAVPLHDNEAAAVNTGSGRTQGEFAMNDTIPQRSGLIPWHGILAPEGKWSGDRRMFKEGSLRNRDVPLPLTYQKVSDDGHKGSITVGSIDWIEKRGTNMHAGGVMLATPEADEAVGLLAHFGRYGVSVDADEAEFDLDTPEDEGTAFSDARVCSAAMVGIPAFAEAYISLGEDPERQTAEPAEPQAAGILQIPEDLKYDAGLLTASILYTLPDGLEVSVEAPTFTSSEILEAKISEGSWDGSASRFTPEEWKRSCIVHRDDSLDKAAHSLPIKEPNGDLSRAGVHAAAGRVNQVDAPDDKKAAAKRALRSAYGTLGEDVPDSLKAAAETESFRIHEIIERDRRGETLSADEKILFDAYWADPVAFGRGPGWLTNPEDTKRIHDYWTRPGEPGYAKIGWGTDGDFNRCRVEVGEEIGENSPEKLRFINQICAQWHHDATGAWPGKAPAEVGHSLEPEGDQAPAVSLVASAATAAPPWEWFQDPKFDRPTPFRVVEEDGLLHLSGHVADWKTCHMGFPGECVNVKPSTTGYAYYLLGETMTDKGPVATGPITLATGHASRYLRARPALAHYDNTGMAVADVACGDDEHGIWVNGWVRPWVSAEKVHELRAHPPSGDWRKNPNSGAMDMIAVLSVNAPGLPIRRVGIKDGEQVSLVASLGPTEETDDGTDALVVDIAQKVAAELEERQARRERLAQLAEEF